MSEKYSGSSEDVDSDETVENQPEVEETQAKETENNEQKFRRESSDLSVLGDKKTAHGGRIRKRINRFLRPFPIFKKDEAVQWEEYSVVLNNSDANRQKKFPNNSIRTSKYTILTFFPKACIYEQFRKVSNVYFTIVMCVQFIPGLSPLIPITSILPLMFVLLVSIITEFVEDNKRHKEDTKNNSLRFQVLEANGVLKEKESKDLQVGDIIRVEDGQVFPADLLLMTSSADDKTCYLQTANLDGETNLKLRRSIPMTETLNETELLAIQGTITCEPPNIHIYHFNGRLELSENSPISSTSVVSTSSSTGSRRLGLDHENFLQRGAQLRNTHYIYAMIVYAGVHTKLFLNMKPAPSKFSTLNHTLNRCVFWIFVIQQCLCLFMAIISGIWDNEEGSGHWYLGDNEYSTGVYIVRNFGTWFILLNVFIPISLWVTLDVTKICQASFMEWDERMTTIDEETGEKIGMIAKTSFLNEDLGRIQHVFSDKTGTLTRNQMKFERCAVRGVDFTRVDELSEAFKDDPERQLFKHIFLQVLSLCHAVVPEKNPNTNEFLYRTPSPDENALMDAAVINHYILIGRTTNTLTITQNGQEVTYELLAVLDFTSDRKRMSVLIRDADGSVHLLCKGADNVIFDRLAEGDDEVKAHTKDLLIEYSKQGLRTLVCAHRRISNNAYKKWNRKFQKAITSVVNREEKLDRVYERLETELELVGCTAIEDRLQDEVPETIDYLLKAGIQVWVLTGDKQETAINIGYSCKLLSPEQQLVIINNISNKEAAISAIDNAIQQYKGSPKESLALVVDGNSLHHCLKRAVRGKLMELSVMCFSVLCCRTSPLQKALVVQAVKQTTPTIALGIGDGANDVSMIQTANIGVGIFGKEGTQAARSSDYAIRQFKDLRILLAIHGRYSYLRLSTLIQYSFYKNCAFTLGLVWFGFFSIATGQTLYDAWIITLFNVIFTSVPPFFHGLMEKDIDEETILKFPEAYRSIQRGSWFSKETVIKWVLSSLWHSIVCFFGSVLAYSGLVLPDGDILGLWSMGLMASTTAVITVILKMALETKYWTGLIHFGIWGSIIVYFIVLVAISSFPSISWVSSMYWVFYKNASSPVFWFGIIVLPSLSLLPDFIYKYVQSQYTPQNYQILQEYGRFHHND